MRKKKKVFPKIILASNSLARKKILKDLRFDLDVVPSDFCEYIDNKKTPQENVVLLAEGKANTVFERVIKNYNSDFLVIGCDTTIVSSCGEFLTKPISRKKAQDMMMSRSGKTEILISGISCILFRNNEIKKFSGYESTKLIWREMTQSEIENILDTGEWEGKCGGVAIEGFTGLYIKKIIGNYHNVMGFPINLFYKCLKKFDLMKIYKTKIF